MLRTWIALIASSGLLVVAEPSSSPSASSWSLRILVFPGHEKSGAFVASRAPASRGRLTHFGNKWGWTEGEAFVPQLVMYATPPHFYNNPGKIDRDIRTFLAEHGFNGFHVFMSCRWFDISENDCRMMPGRDPALDPRTFDALELLITKTHQAGGMVHLWTWGDQERGETPSARPDWGGINGPVGRKVYAEIARRLGPLPGWTMGLGFDLDEWVELGDITIWHRTLHELLPEPHFLGGRPGGPNSGSNHTAYVQWNEALDYSSYEHHRPTYAVYVAALEAVPNQPVMSEDRFRVLEDEERKHYRLAHVRRGLWHSTLAGGVANIWGYLREGGSHDLGSAPFPNREQIETHFRFVRGRFTKDLVRCSPANAHPRREALCLASPRGDRRIFYREDTAEISLNLSGIGGAQPAVAVDTRSAYAEIDLGELTPGVHTWSAPYPSDWALAVGEFPNAAGPAELRFHRTPTKSLVPNAPTELRVRSVGKSRVDIEWKDNSRGEQGFDIERAFDQGGVPGSFEEIAHVGAEETSFSDGSVSPGNAYWYRARAHGEGGESLYSNTVRVFTPAASETALVTNVRPSHYDLATLKPGDEYYIDRDYTIALLPDVLDGAVWIKPANDAKLDRSEHFLSFDVSGDVTVFVAFDRRAVSLPAWLSDWTFVDERVYVTGDSMSLFRLYRRDFRAGRIVLGGNSAPGASWPDTGRSQYVVAVKKRH